MTLHDPKLKDIALRKTIADICAQRDNALGLYRQSAEELANAYSTAIDAAAVAHAAAGGSDHDGTSHAQRDAYTMFDNKRFNKQDSIEAARKVIDARIWNHLIEFTGINRLMDHEAKASFQQGLMDDVPEINEGTVRATLTSLMADADHIWRRGIANVFSSLDRRFRSHNGFKIGSRVILDRLCDENGHLPYGSRRPNHLTDIERVFDVLADRKGSWSILDQIRRERTGYVAQQSTHYSDYFEVRIFKNGNAHLWFTRTDLVDAVNKLLAEYYGDVIPDGMEERAARDIFKDVKLTPAKRFGFFPSPPDVVAAVMDHVRIQPGATVLEPSAGTGNLARAAAARGAIVDCVEIQPEHADGLVNEGIYRKVVCQDFHSFNTREAYDFVLMNPPFDRGRDIDHIIKAWDYVKPGGSLVSVMHAGIEFSETGKAKAFRDFVEKHKSPRMWLDTFEDLPPGSFASVGTYVNTVIVHLKKPD